MRWTRVAIVLIVLTVPTVVRAEQPFLTEEAETLQPGFFTIDFGFSYRENPVDFGVPHREHVINSGETRFSFGVGRFVEPGRRDFGEGRFFIYGLL